MGAVRWVVLSDLHLGADQGLLAEGSHPNAVADALVDGLRSLLGDDQPTLVLAGDAIELALCDEGTALAAFERFLTLLRGDEPVVGHRIVYVPGNHDHHLWQISRQHGWIERLRTSSPAAAPPRMRYTSTLTPAEDLPLAPLVALLRRDPAWLGVFVDAVYPNFALRAPGVDRTVVVHHGHLVEPVYSAMSSLGSLVFADHAPVTVEEIERDNNAWIEFLWSELGRSGAVGVDLRTAYHLLPDAASVSHVTDRLAERLAQRWRRPPLPARVRQWLLRTVADDVLAAGRALETHRPEGVLSAGAEAGLDAYLSGPLRRQLHDERVTGPLSFVFGHTHKPFQQLRDIAGLGDPVPVYNTGGWINERSTVQHTQGAQVILVDDRLAVVAVELYRQHDQPAQFAVRVRDPLVDDEQHRRFHDDVSARVEANAGVWERFGATVAVELEDRRLRLDALYRRFR